ncbi:secreted antigen 1 [Babesia caballi]|uniref:Secreted antigen 1 n=1 Tax=Babesia caballi TaxID=5871 RepID=A0AAV4LY74_BABCB|nr:secreted antigen 1 [Babesia caballi]
MLWPCEGINEPTTLKDALEFLEALYRSRAVLNKVRTKLQRQVPEWINDNADFVERHNWLTDCSNLQTVLVSTSGLRKDILLREFPTLYRNYQSIQNARFISPNCLDKVAEYLMKLLPKFYSTLYYMWFNVDKSCSEWGGATWSERRCDMYNYSENGLHKVLVSIGLGLTSGVTVGYSSGEGARLLAGEYVGGQLGSKTGSELATQLKQLVNYYTQAWLPSLLLEMFLITPWSPCNTATALVVIKVFCNGIVRGSSEADNKGKLRNCKSVCAKLLEHLEAVTPDKQDSNSLLIALYEGSAEYYSKNVKAEFFNRCVLWIQKHEGSLIKSLENMAKDCTSWDLESIQRGDMAGPFAYGFMFGGRWKHKNELSELCAELQKKLLALLNCLPTFINDISATTSPNGLNSDRNHQRNSINTSTNNHNPYSGSNPNPPAIQTSDSSIPVGSAVGAATILGGGGALAYFLDIGGFGSLVKALF